jgi:stromal membrane-associated protein
MPSEAKIENFIRTKYESKRWVMDGLMPDPATLDVDGDDNVPLNIVQEKAKIERSASQRIASALQQPPPPRQPAPSMDLFGDEPPVPPVRPNTTDIPNSKPVARASAAPASTRQTKQ